MAQRIFCTIGLSFNVLGAILVAYGLLFQTNRQARLNKVARSYDPELERRALKEWHCGIAGFVLIIIGFVLQIIAVWIL